MRKAAHCFGVIYSAFPKQLQKEDPSCGTAWSLKRNSSSKAGHVEEHIWFAPTRTRTKSQFPISLLQFLRQLNATYLLAYSPPSLKLTISSLRRLPNYMEFKTASRDASINRVAGCIVYNRHDHVCCSRFRPNEAQSKLPVSPSGLGSLVRNLTWPQLSLAPDRLPKTCAPWHYCGS